MGKRSNIVTGTQYDGTLSINFTETEDMFILRQFTSWLNIEDENAILGTADLNAARSTAIRQTTAENMLAKAMQNKSTLGAARAVRTEKENVLGHKLIVESTNSSAGVNLQKSYIPMTRAMKTDIQLLMYRYNGDDVGYKITYFGCYPKSIGGASFTYESGGGTISYDVEFDYDHYHIQYIDQPERLNPTNNFRSTAAKLIDTMLNIGVRSLFAYIRRNAIAERSDAMFEEPQNRPVPRGLPTDDDSQRNWAEGVSIDDDAFTTSVKHESNDGPIAQLRRTLNLNRVEQRKKLDRTIATSEGLDITGSREEAADTQSQNIHNTDVATTDNISVEAARDLVGEEHVGQNSHEDMTQENMFYAKGEAGETAPLSYKVQNKAGATEEYISTEAARDLVADEHATNQTLHARRDPAEAMAEVANDHATNQTLHEGALSKSEASSIANSVEARSDVDDLLSKTKAKMAAAKTEVVRVLGEENAASPYKIQPFERG